MGNLKRTKSIVVGMLGIYSNIENMQYIRDGKLFEYNEITFDQWMPLLYKVLKERWSLLSNEQLSKL